MSERDEFEVWRENCGYNTESIKGVLWMCWQDARATPQQAVPALTDEWKAGAEHAIAEAVRIINEAREEGESDLRCIRSRIMAIIEDQS